MTEELELDYGFLWEKGDTSNAFDAADRVSHEDVVDRLDPDPGIALDTSDFSDCPRQLLHLT